MFRDYEHHESDPIMSAIHEVLANPESFRLARIPLIGQSLITDTSYSLFLAMFPNKGNTSGRFYRIEAVENNSDDRRNTSVLNLDLPDSVEEKYPYINNTLLRRQAEERLAFIDKPSIILAFGSYRRGIDLRKKVVLCHCEGYSSLSALKRIVSREIGLTAILN